MLSLLYPLRSYIIISGTTEKPNLMTADWVIPLSFQPQLVGVAIGKSRYTRELIDKYKQLVVAVPRVGMEELLLRIGSLSGRYDDKLNFLRSEGYTLIPSEKVTPPSLREAIANLELQVIKRLETGDHIFYICQVLYYTYDETIFPGGLPAPDAKFIVHWDLEGTMRELS